MAAMRRRPSGEPPPLPREDRWTRWIWVLAAVLLAGVTVGLVLRRTSVVQAADQAVLSWFAGARVPPLVGTAKAAHLLTTFAAVLCLRIVTVAVLGPDTCSDTMT